MKPTSEPAAREKGGLAGEFEVKLEKLRADMQTYQRRMEVAKPSNSPHFKQNDTERTQATAPLRLSFMLSSLEAKKREIGRILGFSSVSTSLDPTTLLMPAEPSEDKAEVDALRTEQRKLTDELESIKERLTMLERKSTPLRKGGECKRASPLSL